jgi:CarD family transcriptional regulator
MERKLYDSALQLLVDEVSFSLGISKSEVEELVFDKLEVDVSSDGDEEDIIADDDDMEDEDD